MKPGKGVWSLKTVAWTTYKLVTSGEMRSYTYPCIRDFLFMRMLSLNRM